MTKIRQLERKRRNETQNEASLRVLRPSNQIPDIKNGQIRLISAFKHSRTTCLYWIKQGFEIEDSVLDSLATTSAQMRQGEVASQNDLLECLAVIRLLKEVYEILGHSLRWKRVKSPEQRAQILEAISTAMTQAKRKTCLSSLEMSLSRFKAWKRLEAEGRFKKKVAQFEFPTQTLSSKPYSDR